MNSILAVEKGLPPGLWLPTAEESTEQYLTENFAHINHSYADIVDYGAFIVALALYERDYSGRLSLMPDTRDLKDMHSAGYGISERTLHHKYGGLGRLQRHLGFCPREYEPEAEELIKRFQWIADYSYSLDPLLEGIKNVDDILNWGSARNLVPSRRKVYGIMQGDTSPIRKMFKVERRDYRRQYTHLDVYRFYARVIADNNGPISYEALNKKYTDVFVSSPVSTIRLVYGSYTKLLMEFDYLPSVSRGLSIQDVANFGVRWAIQNKTPEIGTKEIDQLSHEMKFPSRFLIATHYRNIPAFREQVRKDYAGYNRLRQYFELRGVAAGAFRSLSHRYESTEKYQIGMIRNMGVFQKLSVGCADATYVLNIVQKGFNLLDEHIMTMQLEDFNACLSKLKITSPAERYFVYSAVPRINADEAVKN